MGTITLKVPEDIHLEYQIDSSKLVEQLLELLGLKENSIPSSKAVHQWESKAQENLTRYEKTGKLPAKMFDFD